MRNLFGQISPDIQSEIGILSEELSRTRERMQELTPGLVDNQLQAMNRAIDFVNRAQMLMAMSIRRASVKRALPRPEESVRRMGP